MRYLAETETMTRDCVDGLGKVFPEFVQAMPDSFNKRAILKKHLTPEYVNTIVSSGGWGGPFSVSYVFSPDLADAAVNGNICAAPSAYDIYEVARKIGSQKGYILLYNNFMGDCLNNDLALELMEKEGFRGRLIEMTDDVLSVAPGTPREERTGLCGILYATKIASACSKTGASLEEVADLLEYVKTRVSSTLVTVDFENKLINVGEGISGEPARIVYENRFSLDDIAEVTYELLYEDLKPQKNERIYVLVNRTFPTFYEDAAILAQKLHDYSQGRIYQMSAGYYFRMSDHYGFSVTMLSVDERVWPYLEKRCYTDSFIL